MVMISGGQHRGQISKPSFLAAEASASFISCSARAIARSASSFLVPDGSNEMASFNAAMAAEPASAQALISSGFIKSTLRYSSATLTQRKDGAMRAPHTPEKRTDGERWLWRLVGLRSWSKDWHWSNCATLNRRCPTGSATAARLKLNINSGHLFVTAPVSFSRTGKCGSGRC